jgi:hypothetical protein
MDREDQGRQSALVFPYSTQLSSWLDRVHTEEFEISKKNGNNARW